MNFSLKLLRPLGSRQATTSIVIDGEETAVVLRRNSQARRFILRLDRSGDAVSVTVPEFASFTAAMAFTAEHANWIRQQQRKQKPARPFAACQTLPLRDVDHRVVHVPQSRGAVRIDSRAREIHVAGRPEHLARRLKDWLKHTARTDLEEACHTYSSVMGLKFSRITIRDQTSRWGSCSAKGALSFSWRLILAPEFVLDYVAAHEVAHLQEMNHGPAFWALVERHCPQADEARRWLKTHGANLHRYGR